MSISSQIVRIKNAIAAAYLSAGKKGATLPAKQSVDNLAAAIDSIMTGADLSYADELYSADVSISYSSTSAGTAKTISNIANLCKYPFVVVIIENANTSIGAKKFVRSITVIANVNYGSGGVSVTRYGVQHYYNSSNALTNLASTSYGLWGYTISTANALTIRGRVNSNYYTSLTGTYKIRVLGIKF